MSDVITGTVYIREQIGAPMSLIMLVAGALSSLFSWIAEGPYKFEHWVYKEQLEKQGMKYVGSGIWISRKDE